MCGIVGYWNTKENFESSKLIKDLIKTINKRGPDDKGIWIEKKLNLVFGHSRLSIQDLSKAGKQPYLSSKNDWIILFNGEIYNQYNLRNKLNNYIWKGHSDTETIAEYISEYGINKFRAKANGMYAIAAYEISTKSLFLMRDSFGEKPLYYYSNNGDFCFSSTIEGLQKYNKNNLQIDKKTAINFINYGFIPNQNSIFQKVKSISPGELIKVTLTKAEDNLLINKYTKVSYDNFFNPPPVINSSEIFNEIDEIISKSVEERLIGDQKVGCFLSGGIDSSLIAAYAQKKLNGNLETFSIGFETSGFDESPFAEEVSKILQTKHRCFYLQDKDVLKITSNLKNIFDEPFADQSQIGMIHLCDKVRNEAGIKVALSGDGGDELFCGYNRYTRGYEIYKALKKNKLFEKLLIILKITPFEFIDKLLHILPRKIRFSATRNLAYKLLNVLNSKNIYEYYISLISRNNIHFLKDEKSIKILRNELIEEISQILETNENVFDNRTKLMIIDQNLYLPNDILVKSDRSSMHFGLEVRAPYLEPNIKNWCLHKGQNYQYLDKKSKYVLRNLLKKHIPKYNFDRPKMGFGVPLDIWLRTCLKEWTEDIIYSNNMKLDPIINNDTLVKRWEKHKNGDNQALSIWPILVYGSWRYNI